MRAAVRRIIVAAAALLLLAGVEPGAVVADYEATEANMPALLDRLRDIGYDIPPDVELPPEFVTAPAEAITVVVDRLTDEDLSVLPHGATGSTDVALIRPAPEEHSGPVYVYLASDVGLPRRQLIGVPFGPNGWRGEPRTLAARDDAELEFVDADDAGRLLLLPPQPPGGNETTTSPSIFSRATSRHSSHSSWPPNPSTASSTTMAPPAH